MLTVRETYSTFFSMQGEYFIMRSDGITNKFLKEEDRDEHVKFLEKCIATKKSYKNVTFKLTSRRPLHKVGAMNGE